MDCFALKAVKKFSKGFILGVRLLNVQRQVELLCGVGTTRHISLADTVNLNDWLRLWVLTTVEA